MNKIFNNIEHKNLRKKLRNNRPEPEIKLWYYLRKNQLGVKFRRQSGIGNYIVDFYCPEKRLVIEIDGDSHFDPIYKERDKIRDNYLTDLNLRVLRFTNLDVINNIEGVVIKIHQLIITTPTPP